MADIQEVDVNIRTTEVERSGMEAHNSEGGPSLRRNRAFPPPLPSLATKSNSHFPTHMPLVLLQPIRSKGRFVLQEVLQKNDRHLMLQPIRTNGRLILQLVWHDHECHQIVNKEDNDSEISSQASFTEEESVEENDQSLQESTSEAEEAGN